MGILDFAPDWLKPGPAKNPYAGQLSDSAWEYYRRNQLGRNLSRAGDFLTRAAYGDYTGGQRTGGGQNDLVKLMKTEQMLRDYQYKTAKRQRERQRGSEYSKIVGGLDPTTGINWNMGRALTRAPTTALASGEPAPGAPGQGPGRGRPTTE